MTDPVDRFFEREREAVPTLSPPPGLFDELQTVARRKRNRNTTMVSAAAAVVLAVVGTGAVLGAQSLDKSSTNAANPAAPTSAVSSVAVASTPTATVSSIAGVNAAVPTGFKVWSVTFVGSSGWALGGYTCGTGQCVALLQSDNYAVDPGSTVMPTLTWRTVFKPSLAQTTALGLSSGTATVRFGSHQSGWIVAGGKVLETRDGGADWQHVTAMSSVYVTALEASGSKAFAVTADGKALWVETVSTGSWRPTKRLALPTSRGGQVPQDSIQLEVHMVAVARTLGATTTVRFSPILKASWSSINIPCPAASVAPEFLVTDENTSRVVCGDGTVYDTTNVGGSAVRATSLPAGSLAASGVTAASIATDGADTVAAYAGAGLLATFDNGHSWAEVQNGSFSYVGLTDSQRGVALDAGPSSRVWFSADGGRHWAAQSFG